MVFKTPSWAVTLRMLCAVALMCLGFAHKAAPAYAGDAYGSEYQLPDGSFADLCVFDHAAPHPEKHDGENQSCEFCRLVSAAVLPAPPDAWLVTRFSSMAAEFQPDLPFALNPASGEPRSRGPPSYV